MNIDTIRQLLASYYDGSASDAEIDTLKRYFTQVSDLPADLRVDAAIFRAMASTQPLPMPADLHRRIVDATIGSSRRRLFVRWRSALSAAAAVALAIMSGLWLLKSNDTAQPGNTVVASTTLSPQIAPDPLPAQSIDEKPAQQVATEPVEIVVRTVHSRATKAQAKPHKRAGYREITDSVQVVEFTSRLLAKLEAPVEGAERGIRYTSEAIARINDPLGSNPSED